MKITIKGFVLAAAACLVLQSCFPSGFERSDENGRGIDRVGVSRTEEKTISADGVVSLSVKTDIGMITVRKAAPGDGISLSAEYTAKAGTRERAEKLLDSVAVSVTAAAGTVSVVSKDNNAVRNGMINESVSTDFILAVPESVRKISLESDVGKISAEDVAAEWNIRSDVGEILLKRAALFGDSRVRSDVGAIRAEKCPGGGGSVFESDVGNIEFDECLFSGSSLFMLDIGSLDISGADITEAEMITAESKMGSIRLSVKNSGQTGYEAQIRRSGKKETETKGDGRTKIRLSTEMGSVSID